MKNSNYYYIDCTDVSLYNSVYLADLLKRRSRTSQFSRNTLYQ